MGFVSNTKEIIDRYYAANDFKDPHKHRTTVDTLRLYAYEEEIGTQLVDMNFDQIIDMLRTFKKQGLNAASLELVYGKYKRIVEFYIDTEYIQKGKSLVPINHFRGPECTWPQIWDRIKCDNEVTEENIRDALTKIEENINYAKAAIHKTAFLMFYEGVPNASTLLDIKRSDVDLESKTISVKGRVMHISDELADTLKKVDMLDEIFDQQGRKYVFKRYDGSAIKILRRATFADKADYEKREATCVIINKLITDTNEYTGQRITARKLYLAGVYKFLVCKFGREETNQKLVKARSVSDNADLTNAFAEYGYEHSNLTNAKKALRPYIV